MQSVLGVLSIRFAGFGELHRTNSTRLSRDKFRNPAINGLDC